MRPSFVLAAALGTGLLLTGCIDIDFGSSDRYQEPFHYSYDLRPGARVNLESFNGSVEITGWDQNKVEITGVKYASTEDGLRALRVDVRNEADYLDVRTERPSVRHGNWGARYTVQMPKGAVLDRITTTNAQIRVRNLDSGGRFKTSNGAIRAENLKGLVDARTTNGMIEVHNIAGGATMKTTNGRIRAEDVGGECSAETSNGSIELAMQSVPKSGIRAETSNGAITVRLPSGAGAQLEANTTNSSINTEMDVNGNVNGVTGNRGHLSGTIGAGGPLIELSTRNGRISVLRR
jgi:hypothetical protein